MIDAEYVIAYPPDRTARLPIRGPALGADRYLELMRSTEIEGGEIRFVVIANQVSFLRPAPDEWCAK